VSSWINLKAIWEILVVGLLAGAGLPALVALGLLALSPSPGPSPGPRAASGTAVAARPNPVRVAVAALCFAVVLAAIGYGIYLIVKSGHSH
jgi:hypothetical protein